MSDPVGVVFPGDWIEYISEGSSGSFVIKIGRVLEIREDGLLKVSHRFDSSHRLVRIKRVVKKYPRFMVLPIPGKIKDE